MSDLRTAYQGRGDAWARGPSLLYDRLAVRIIETAALPLRDALVLDAGAGTGAICRVLTDARATAIALDTSADMLAHVGDAALHAVVGDICSLPFLDGSFDAVISAFSVSHVSSPERALAEMGRVVKPSGWIIAAVFGAAPPSAAKDVIDEVARAYGYQPPSWYVQFKTVTEPMSNTPERLRTLAQTAGLADAAVEDITIDSALESPEELVEYRTGMAHLAPFVSSLAREQRDRFVGDAVAAVRARGQALMVRVLILSSRPPA